MIFYESGIVKKHRLSDLIVNICFTREDDINLRKAVERLVFSVFHSCEKVVTFPLLSSFSIFHVYLLTSVHTCV